MTSKNQPQNAGQNPSQGSRSNDPKNVQQTTPDQRRGEQDRERNVDAPRNESGNQSGKNPPRYDDRPGQQRGGTDDAQANTPQRSGVPNYGDKEPGDPRRLDVDAGTGGRDTSAGGGRTNPSPS